MKAAGILTARGGMTSHAAVVARGMGKCCVAAPGAVHVDPRARSASGGEPWVKQATGSRSTARTGEVSTAHPMRRRRPELSGDFGKLMELADKTAAGVRANADTPADARTVARTSAPTGIGLAAPSTCSSRASASSPMREMILADDEAGRRKRAGASCCRSSAATSRACSARWTACR